MKQLNLTEETDKATARRKLDTCLANLDELRRAVEALKLSLDDQQETE
jgi:ubiquinone biosynthesis protein UbiJ